jgi:hypothetical protein
MFFGIFLILIGIIWKLFIIGFKINKFFNWISDWKKNRENEKTEKISKEKKFWKKNKKI